MKLILCNSYLELTDKNHKNNIIWINPDHIVSVIETPKKEVFIKLIDGSQVSWYGTKTDLDMRLSDEKWNQKKF